MENDEIRKIIFRNYHGYRVKINRFSYRRRAFHQLTFLKKTAKNQDTDSEVNQWNSENSPLLIPLIQSLDFKNFEMYEEVSASVAELLRNAQWEGNQKEVYCFFESVSKNQKLNEKVLFSIRTVFFCELLHLLCDSFRKNKRDSIRLYQVMHRLICVDFHSAVLSNSLIEHYFRLDPAGVYNSMTKDTKFLYRFRLEREAQKKGVSVESLCRGKLAIAKKEKKHIGFYLNRKKPSVSYRIVIPSLFAMFYLPLILVTKSASVAFLTPVPLYFFCKNIADFIYHLITKNEVLPQLKLDTVTDECETCVVITSVLSSEKTLDDLCEKIKRYSLNNSKPNDRLFFGLLLDLKESKNEFEKEDENLLKKLKIKIDDLNVKDNRYFACVRKRTYHKGLDSFAGRERKRGAIEDFVSFITGKESLKDANFYGLYEELVGSRYLITLDQDTMLSLGQAKRMIGTMLHPLNQAVIDWKKGKPIVVSGHGILQPRISTSLKEPILTPYGKILGNGSGRIPYASAGFDTLQSLFGVGNFCGKGIIDTFAFDTVLRGRFPKETILSHDMPEGALLRCGLMTQEYFYDSNPQTLESDYRRKHRWIRGDIQNLVILKDLPVLQRRIAIENAVRPLAPFFEFLMIFLSLFLEPKLSLALVSIILLFRFLPIISTALNFALQWNPHLWNRRFSTKMRNVVLNSFYLSVLGISSIAFDVYFHLDAVFRSVYRMVCSKKKLLQWQVYSSEERSKNAMLFFLPSALIASLCLFICRYLHSLVILLLWLVFPLGCAYLSRPYQKRETWNEKEKQFFISCAKKEFLFFENSVTEKTNYLPPDNVQFHPTEKIATNTSPTNIGLYLLSLIAMKELNFLDQGEFYKRLSEAVKSIESLEKYKGLLYNWYDTATLQPIGNKFISTVDCGNYVASLIVLSEYLKKCDALNQKSIDLYQKIEAWISESDLSILYDYEKELFCIGLHENGNKSDLHYDLYYSEARITSYLAIALEKVNYHHWQRLSRPIFSYRGRVGLASWSGTAFEAFMPSLFFTIVENSLEDESLEYTLYCQEKFLANSDEEKKVFGVSESGYSMTDASGNYQYYAFGVPYTAIAQTHTLRKVISPYSSFLMLERGRRSVVKNLKNLESMGMLGPWGYYEAVEFHSDFLYDYTQVFSYMSHHKGMSILSLYNAVSGNNISKLFMSYSGFQEKSELLSERFPIEAKPLVLKNQIQNLPIQSQELFPSFVAFSMDKKYGSCFSDGKSSFVAFDDGEIHLNTLNILWFSPKIKLSLKEENGKALDLPFKNSEDGKVLLSASEVLFINRVGDREIKFAIYPLPGENAFLFRVEANGIYRESEITLEFDPILMNSTDYQSHPAFHHLSLELSKESSHLSIRKRGVDSAYYLHCDSSMPFQVSVDQVIKDENFENLAKLYSPVKLIWRVTPKGNAVLNAVFTLSSSHRHLTCAMVSDGSGVPNYNYSRKREYLNQRVMQRFNFDASCQALERELLGTLYRNGRFILCEKIEKAPKDFLWKYGISGDSPIISFLFTGTKEDQKNLKRYLNVFGKLNFSFVYFDFVILHSASTEYFDSTRDALQGIVRDSGLEFLIGQRNGIHCIPVFDDSDCKSFADLSLCCVNLEAFDTHQSIPFARFSPMILRSFSGKGKQVAEMKNKCITIRRGDYNPQYPLSHVISNRLAGFVCDQNSLGYTWFKNSGLGRISKWENLPDGFCGEKIILKKDEIEIDLIRNANVIRYLPAFVQYSGEINGDPYEIVATAIEKIGGKNISVFLSGSLSKGAKLFYSFVPIIGRDASGNFMVRVEKSSALFTPVLKNEFDFSGYFSVIGRNISVFHEKDRLVFSFNAEKENLCCLGGVTSKQHWEYVDSLIQEKNLQTMLENERLTRKELFPQSFDNELEFWLWYQCVASRFYGRTGLYQSSGAYGFRDQLQDSLLFLKLNSDLTKQQILRAASHQSESGVVLHWWHSSLRPEIGDQGVFTKCSDDYLWLIYVLSEYCDETGDEAILELSAPFLKDVLLGEKESERYVRSERISSGTLREHIIRSVRLFLSRGLGAHGLPPMGSGDWNDGMNQVFGESVWLGFFGAICLNRAMPFVSKELQWEIRQFLFRLSKGLRGAFQGGWFPRAYSAAVVLGCDKELKSECSIDLITQAFAGFYQEEFKNTEFALNSEHVITALESAFHFLVDRENRTTALLKEPFRDTDPSPGYIQRYTAGVRENGGQYTHAAVWFGMALLKMGTLYHRKDLIEKSIVIADLIDPTANLNSERYEKYQREPYVLCGDVYTAKNAKGRGGWSWYTGAAAWYYRFLQDIKKVKKG